MLPHYLKEESPFEQERFKYLSTIFPSAALSFPEVEDKEEREKFERYSQIMYEGDKYFRGVGLWQRTNMTTKYGDDPSIWIALTAAYLCLERGKVFSSAMKERGVQLLNFGSAYSETGTGVYFGHYLSDYETVNDTYLVSTGEKGEDLGTKFDIKALDEKEAPSIVAFVIKNEEYIQKDLNHLIDLLLKEINKGEMKIERPTSYSNVVSLVNDLRRKSGMLDSVEDNSRDYRFGFPSTQQETSDMFGGEEGIIGSTPLKIDIFKDSGFTPQDGFGTGPFASSSSTFQSPAVSSNQFTSFSPPPTSGSNVAPLIPVTPVPA